MPIHKIEVEEYECAKCGWKWINRYNGQNKPIPKRCAKCKNKFWNEGLMSEDEKYWRNRLRYYYGTYDKCMAFLNVVPRPTIEELKTVYHYAHNLFYESEQNEELNTEEDSETLHEKCDEFMQKIIDSRK